MDIPNSLDKYKTFYCVAKEGNITRASEVLYISQPAVSMVIKNLEEELNAKLFIRSKKGVVLTPTGQKIFDEVEKGLNHFSQLSSIVKKEIDNLQGELNIGCGSNAGKKFLTKPLKKFLSLHPNIVVNQIKEVQEELFSMLSNGKLDLVISQFNGEEENLKFTRLNNVSYVFVKNPDLKEMRFIKYHDGSFMNNLFNGFIEKKGLGNIPHIKVSGYSLAIELASAGLGVTIAPLFMVEDKIKEGKLEIVYKDYKLPSAEFGYFYNESLLSEPAKEMIKCF